MSKRRARARPTAIQERDVEILRFLYRAGYATTKTIGALFFQTGETPAFAEKVAVKRLNQLYDGFYLNRLEWVSGLGAPIYVYTLAGRSDAVTGNVVSLADRIGVSAESLRTACNRKKRKQVQHSLYVGHLYAALLRGVPSGWTVAEWQDDAALRQRKLTVTISGTRPRTFAPDAYFLLTGPEGERLHFFAEIDHWTLDKRFASSSPKSANLGVKSYFFVNKWAKLNVLALFGVVKCSLKTLVYYSGV